MNAPTRTEPAPAAPPPTRAGRGLVGLAALVVVPGALGAAFAHVAIPRTHAAAPPAKAVAATTALYELPELVVNLASSQGQRYLKLRCALQLRGKTATSAKERLVERQAVVRDSLIRLLSAKTLERVEPADAKETIKLEILDVLNRSVFSDGEATAERLYFVEFIVQ